ncbi:MAG: sugar transferase [Candidatus Kapabacteria bacterium]|nr:sugar transferase [Candidatus Kapabacteria bacterium]
MRVYSEPRNTLVVDLHAIQTERQSYLRMKRALDVVLALTMIVLSSPLLLITALLIKLTTRGPVIYTQIRLGQYGHKFLIYKFRTMYTSADFDHEQFGIEKAKGTFIKSPKDPRITPIGRYLRNTSIDELPQLFNVLFGDMSIVGPRPSEEFFFLNNQRFKDIRLIVKPGMTGLWQVKNRSNHCTIFDMIDYDIEYIQNMNLWNDIKIIFLTIPAVLQGEGAV